MYLLKTDKATSYELDKMFEDPLLIQKLRFILFVKTSSYIKESLQMLCLVSTVHSQNMDWN